MEKLIDSLIPIDTCRRYLPLSQNRDQAILTLVAMVDPDNLEAQDHLTGFCGPEAWRCNTWYSTLEDFQQIISIPG